jgi:hypothetical protein
VQLEAGSVATPFEFEDFGTTVEKCQRYFSKSYNLTVAPATTTTVGARVFELAANANQEHACTFEFPTAMRTTPTVTGYSPQSGASGNFRVFDVSRGLNADSAVTVLYAGEKSAAFSCTFNGSNMQGHYRADAEL